MTENKMYSCLHMLVHFSPVLLILPRFRLWHRKMRASLLTLPAKFIVRLLLWPGETVVSNTRPSSAVLVQRTWDVGSHSQSRNDQLIVHLFWVQLKTKLSNVNIFWVFLVLCDYIWITLGFRQTLKTSLYAFRCQSGIFTLYWHNPNDEFGNQQNKQH